MGKQPGYAQAQRWM